MGSKNKTENMKEYQREYYLRNRKKEKGKYKTENMKEYQREYYLKNIEIISAIRAEFYNNKVNESSKTKNNVVIVLKEIIISILEN